MIPSRPLLWRASGDRQRVRPVEVPWNPSIGAGGPGENPHRASTLRFGSRSHQVLSSHHIAATLRFLPGLQGAPSVPQRVVPEVSRKKPLEKRREEGEEGARAGKKLKGRGISTFPAAAPHHRYPAIQILSLAVPPTFASIGRGGRCPSSPPRIGSPHEEGSCTPSRGSPSCPPSPQAPTDTVRGRNPILPSLQTLIDSINNTLQRRQSTTTLRDLFSTGAPYYATPHW